MNVGAREVSGDAVSGQHDRAGRIFAVRLGQLVQEGLQNDPAGQTTVTVKLSLGDHGPRLSVVRALEDLKVRPVRRAVRSGGQDGRYALLAVLVEQNGAAVASRVTRP